MKKEIQYESICLKIASLFSELAEIIEFIKKNYKEEHAQDPQLNLHMIDKSLKITLFNKQAFEGYKNRTKENWSFEKYLEYAKDDLISFFREFDNPFLGSKKWTLRIKELIDLLSKEYDELDKLSN